MNRAYLAEAFKQLELLNEEDYNISSDPSAIEDAVDIANADGVMSMDIIDDGAMSEEELQDSYEGKVILDCSICHSKLYKNREEVFIDDEQDLANVGEECPFCYNNDGFHIIGQVAPFISGVEEEPEVEETEEQETVEIEAPVEDNEKQEKEDVDESLDDELTESSVNESIENATVTTTEDTMVVTPKEDGGVVIETTPNEYTEPECGGEMIAPLEPEVEQGIEMNEPEPDEDGNVDIPIDNFDEETFDELGESYLKNTYDNVNSYKTESIKEKNDKLVIEGLITFNSGNTRKTSFIFEAKDVTKSGRIRMIGENCQISRGKKSFTVAGRMNEGKFISESLNYNYRAKDVDGKSTRMYGTVRTNK